MRLMFQAATLRREGHVLERRGALCFGYTLDGAIRRLDHTWRSGVFSAGTDERSALRERLRGRAVLLAVRFEQP